MFVVVMFLVLYAAGLGTEYWDAAFSYHMFVGCRQKFRWTGENNYFIKCSDDSICIGCGM